MKTDLFTKIVFLLILGCLVVISSLTWAETYRKRSDDVRVENYYRKNGTYVAPHYRRPPNAYKDDNYNWKPSQPHYNPSYYQPTKEYKSEWYQKDWDVYYDNLNKSYRPETPPKKKSSTDLPLFQEKIKQPDIYYDKPQQQTPPYQRPIYQKKSNYQYKPAHKDYYQPQQKPIYQQPDYSQQQYKKPTYKDPLLEEYDTDLEEYNTE